MPTAIPEWKQKCMALSVLYLMVERGRQYSTLLEGDDAFAEPVFTRMFQQDLLDITHNVYQVTDKGREVLKGAIRTLDVVRQFEIFAHVDLTRYLQPGEVDPDTGDVLAGSWDPRFPTENTEHCWDLRLALIQWLNHLGQTTEDLFPSLIDVHEVVFIQRLGAGLLGEKDFWVRLRDGEIFSEIDEVVSTAYQWTDLSPQDRQAASEIMGKLYSAGLLENRKRDGSCCSGCNSPIYCFEDSQRKAGLSPLTKCPICGREFGPPPQVGIDGMKCPKCGAVSPDNVGQCGTCGALFDFSLPMGTVQTETTVTEETTVWAQDYGYVSYGWLDPWDPFVDAMFLGALCLAVW